MKLIRPLTSRWKLFLAGVGVILFIDLAEASDKPRAPDHHKPALIESGPAILGLVATNRVRQATELALQFLDDHPAEIDTHFAVAEALMQAKNCPAARPYFDQMLRLYKRTKFYSKLFGVKRACYPTWQRQLMVQLQTKQHIYPDFAQAWQIKPETGSRIDRYCKFIGISCTDNYLQIARPATRKQASFRMAMAAQREQQLNNVSLYNLALTYERHIAGWPTMPAEILSASAFLTHQPQHRKSLSYGVRLGAYRTSIGDSLQSDTAEWLGFEIGAHHILRKRLIIRVKTALDQIQSNYMYGAAVQATGELSGYVTANQNLTVTVADINNHLSRRSDFAHSRQNTIYLTYKNRLSNHHLLILGIEKSYEQHAVPKPYLAKPHVIDGHMIKAGTELTPKRWPWIRFGNMLKWQRFRSVDALSNRHIVQLDLYAISSL